MLLQELTDKLPPQIKLSWAMYKRTITSVSISSFATWLQDMADAASEVTLSFHEENTSAKLNCRKERRKRPLTLTLLTHRPLTRQNISPNPKRNLNIKRRSPKIKI